MASVDIGSGFYLKGADDLSMLFNDQINLGAVVGPPVINAGLAFLILDQTIRLQYNPLFKEPAEGLSVHFTRQTLINRIHDSQIKKIKLRMRHKPPAKPFPVGLKPESDQSILENLIVGLNSPYRQAALPRGGGKE